MRRTFIFVPLLFIAGCVPSKNPYYLPEDAVFVEALLGEWQGFELLGSDREAKWFAFEKGDGKTMMMTDKDEKRYPSQLFRLGNHYFIDQITKDDSGKEWHVLFKVSFVGDRMEWWTLDPQWLARLLRADSKAIGHERSGDNTSDIALTAPTKDLQAFVLKYAEDPSAFLKFVRFSRAKEMPVANEGFASKKQRTADYWYEVCMTMRSTQLTESPVSRDDLLKELQRIASELENLPRDKGIDAEAMECGQEAAVTFRRLVKYVDARTEVAPGLIAAFRRDANTDRLVTAKESVEDRELRLQIAATIDLFNRARETLSRRHGVKLMGIRE
jgi:hypothetical protein